MKPTNKKEYNRSILGFFVMWAITTALIVFACLKLLNTPKFENASLKKEVEALKRDSTQQYLLHSTITGINATMASLNQRYDEDTLRKFNNYPNPKLENTEMKKQLTTMSGRIATMYENSSENSSDVARRLQDCESKLDISERDLQSQKDEVQKLLRENNSLKTQIYQ